MKKIVVIGLSGESVFINIDHFNKIGETINCLNRFTEPGGKGYNQAVCLGKLKADVSFITAVGKDRYANTCMEVLQNHNVKPCFIRKDYLTDYAVITTNSNGENNVIVDNKLSMSVTFNDIMLYKEEIDNCDIILLQMEYPIDTLIEIIKYAHSIGKIVVLNPAPSHIIPKEIIGMVDILIPNEFEIHHIGKNTIFIDEIFKDLYDNGVKNIIVTRGSKSVLSYNGTKKEYKTVKCDVLDTTGAGDCFCAGLVYGLAMEYDLDKMIKFAICTSSLSVRKHGVLEGLPTLDMVLEELEKYD